MTLKPIRVAELVRGPVAPITDASRRRAFAEVDNPGVEVLAEPTQVRRPWRAVLRTFVQTIIPTLLALELVVPEVIKIILDETGDSLPESVRAWLLAVSAGIATVAAIIARIMALPSVERLLRTLPLLKQLAAAPSPEQEQRAA